MKKMWDKAIHWHLAHKGESLAHLGYLSATFIEGHGMHAVLAAMVVAFIMLGHIAEVLTGD